LPWTAYSEHQEVWAGPSWSSTALRYDVAFFWSLNPFYHMWLCSCVAEQPASQTQQKFRSLGVTRFTSTTQSNKCVYLSLPLHNTSRALYKCSLWSCRRSHPVQAAGHRHVMVRHTRHGVTMLQPCLNRVLADMSKLRLELP
jgi:hypothetical protein